MKSGKTGVWFWMVIDEYKKRAGCGSSLRMIERKVVHVKRVVKWGKRIMKGGGKGWDTRLGEVVCLLHDVGRFPQSLYGTFNDGKSINHAKVGRKMFMDSELNDEWTKAVTGTP